MRDLAVIGKLKAHTSEYDRSLMSFTTEAGPTPFPNNRPHTHQSTSKARNEIGNVHQHLRYACD